MAYHCEEEEGSYPQTIRNLLYFDLVEAHLPLPLGSLSLCTISVKQLPVTPPMERMARLSRALLLNHCFVLHHALIEQRVRDEAKAKDSRKRQSILDRVFHQHAVSVDLAHNDNADECKHVAKPEGAIECVHLLAAVRTNVDQRDIVEQRVGKQLKALVLLKLSMPVRVVVSLALTDYCTVYESPNQQQDKHHSSKRKVEIVQALMYNEDAIVDRVGAPLRCHYYESGLILFASGDPGGFPDLRAFIPSDSFEWG